MRDESGHSQGTILIEVKEKKETGPTGHLRSWPGMSVHLMHTTAGGQPVGRERVSVVGRTFYQTFNGDIVTRGLVHNRVVYKASSVATTRHV